MMTDNTEVDFQGVSVSLSNIDSEVQKMNRDLEGIASYSSSLRKSVAEELAQTDDGKKIVELVETLQQLLILELQAKGIDV